MEVWRAVCGRGRGSPPTYKRWIWFKVPRLSPSRSVHTRRLRTSTGRGLCLKKVTVQCLFSARGVMEADSHSCLSLFFSSLLLPRMVVSTIYLICLWPFSLGNKKPPRDATKYQRTTSYAVLTSLFKMIFFPFILLTLLKSVISLNFVSFLYFSKWPLFLFLISHSTLRTGLCSRSE